MKQGDGWRACGDAILHRDPRRCLETVMFKTWETEKHALWIPGETAFQTKEKASVKAPRQEYA